MDRSEVIKILVQEIRDQEQEVRQQLRTSTQNANLSVVIIALVGTFFATQLNIVIFCILPVLLNIAALSNLNTAIDVAHQAIIRDWLQRWANNELCAPIFLVGELTRLRRLSPSGIAVNVAAFGVLLASWIASLIVAAAQTWFWAQIVGALIMSALSSLAVYDYVTIRRRTEEGLLRFTPNIN